MVFFLFINMPGTNLMEPPSIDSCHNEKTLARLLAYIYGQEIRYTDYAWWQIDTRTKHWTQVPDTQIWIHIKTEIFNNLQPLFLNRGNYWLDKYNQDYLNQDAFSKAHQCFHVWNRLHDADFITTALYYYKNILTG